MFQVKNNQVDMAIEIMREVASWGRSIGLRVWLDEWLTREALITDEAREETFCVGYIDGEPACSLILQWQDKEWWPSSKEHEAAYIHKLCVRRPFAGQGIPVMCLNYAIEECKKKGAKFVRLDTGWEEVKMREIYTNMGFEIVDKVALKNGNYMALYEYKIKE